MVKLEDALRPLLVKVLTRGILWLLVTVLGMSAVTTTEPATQAALGLGSLAAAMVAFAIDRWHHRKDLAEPPKSDG